MKKKNPPKNPINEAVCTESTCLWHRRQSRLYFSAVIIPKVRYWHLNTHETFPLFFIVEKRSFRLLKCSSPFNIFCWKFLWGAQIGSSITLLWYPPFGTIFKSDSVEQQNPYSHISTVERYTHTLITTVSFYPNPHLQCQKKKKCSFLLLHTLDYRWNCMEMSYDDYSDTWSQLSLLLHYYKNVLETFKNDWSHFTKFYVKNQQTNDKSTVY